MDENLKIKNQNISNINPNINSNLNPNLNENKNTSNISNNDISNENNKNYDFNCYDLNKRLLKKGQWVDVKDTVDQWLDAQIMDVKPDNSEVFIHYIGWADRWDEWIPMNSPRIMPFRYHTRQSVINDYTSPFPNKRIEINNNSLINNCDNDKNNIFNVFKEVDEIN